MDEKRVDDMLKLYFSGKSGPGEQLRAQIEQKACERSEKRSNILLCIIQTAMVLLTIAIAVAVFFLVSGTLITALIIGGILAGNLACVIIVIFQSRNYKTSRRVQNNE